jgi:hypothetical protein
VARPAAAKIPSKIRRTGMQLKSPLVHYPAHGNHAQRFGPNVLQLAVRSWLKRARKNPRMPLVRRRNFEGLTALHLEPKFGD